MADEQGQFRPRPAPRRLGARAAGRRSSASCGTQCRAAGWRPARRLPPSRPGGRPGVARQHRGRGVRPAGGRGLAGGAAGLGHPGGRPGRSAAPASDGRPPARGRPLRPARRAPGSVIVPPRGVAALCRSRRCAMPRHRSFGYGDPRGLPELRAALAATWAGPEACMSPADRIVVCSGFTQGLALLCRALSASGGQSIAVRGVGIGAHRDVAAANGLVPMPIADRRRGRGSSPRSGMPRPPF